MSQSQRSESALHQQFFGVDTEGVCDDIENAVGDILCDALDELENVLTTEDSVLLDTEQIRACIDQVMFKYQGDTVEHCEVFKTYACEQLFTISAEVGWLLEVEAAAANVPSTGAESFGDEERALDAELSGALKLAFLKS
jgi:hypothetical protein